MPSRKIFLNKTLQLPQCGHLVNQNPEYGSYGIAHVQRVGCPIIFTQTHRQTVTYSEDVCKQGKLHLPKE